MPDMDGFALLRRALEIDPALPVVLVTGHGDVPLAVEAMRAGAYDFIEKPFDTAHLASVVARALEKRRLVLAVRKLRQELETGRGLEARLVGQLGRASCRERVCQYLKISVVAVSLTQNNPDTYHTSEK